MSTPWPSQKRAAARLGLTVEEYVEHRRNNEMWCRICKAWIKVDAFKDTHGPYCETHFNERERARQLKRREKR